MSDIDKLPRFLAVERRLRDIYPPILREAGLDEATVQRLMADYDSPYIDTMCPVSAAQLLSPETEPTDMPPPGDPFYPC